MRRVFAWFSHFCMSLPHLCPFLATTIRLSKDNSKIINSSFSQRVCVYGPLLEVKISAISCKLKATYVFVFVLSAILNASILEPKISTRYHVYDCVNSGVDFSGLHQCLNQSYTKDGIERLYEYHAYHCITASSEC